MNHAISDLDAMDLSILKYLQEDGRMSFTELANILNVSVGMVRNRYNRLVERNILHIIGWTDPVKAGLNAYARVMIKVQPTDQIKSVTAELLKLDEVSFLAITSGHHDLEINLVCRTNQHLLNVVHEQIHTIQGVFETNTTMYLEIKKWAAHDISIAMKNKEERASEKIHSKDE